MGARITEDVLNERLDIIKKSKNIALVGEFQSGKNIRNSFKCLTCGYEFKSTLWQMQKGPQGCGRCSGKVLTPQDITDRLKALHDRGILFEDVYTNITAKYNFRCLKCDYTWNAALTHLHHSETGCGRCNKVRLSEQDIQDKILEMKARGIELLDPYRGMSTKHRFKCHKHDFEWLATFDNISRGKGCAKCAGRFKTPKAIENTKALTIIRNHLHAQQRNGKIGSRPARINIIKGLAEYWNEQWLYIPEKPGKDYSLDHIIPMSLFDPNDIESMRLCWDYRNFQWLTKSQNSAKFNRLEPKYFTAWHYEVLDKMGIKI